MSICKKMAACGLAAAFAGLSSSQVLALGLAVNGGNGSIGATLSAQLVPNLIRTDLSYLNTGHAHGSADIYSADLMLAPRLPLIHPEVGVRYSYQTTRFGNGGGLSPGGSLYIDILPRLLQIGAYGFYTPKGLSQNHLRKSYDYGVMAKVRLLGKLYLSAGYGISRSHFDHRGGHNLYHGPLFGASMAF